jgi:hypothetical protein
LALIDGEPNQEDLQIAAKILARYSQGRDERSVDVEVKLDFLYTVLAQQKQKPNHSYLVRLEKWILQLYLRSMPGKQV